MGQLRPITGLGEAEVVGLAQSDSGRDADGSAGEADAAVLRFRIAARADRIFLARGRQHGSDWADWFQAEWDVLAEERAAEKPEQVSARPDVRTLPTCAVCGRIRHVTGD